MAELPKIFLNGPIFPEGSSAKAFIEERQETQQNTFDPK